MSIRVRNPSQDDDAGGRRDWPLEQQLRRLPPPAVPAGLEARLLAAAPDVARRPGNFRPVRWAAPAVAAAVMAAVMLRPSSQNEQRQGATSFENARETAPLVVLPTANSSETRPCDILPPLPFSS